MSVREDLFVKRLLEMHDKLFNFAFKFTSDRDCALDLLQDTILKALYNRGRFIENTNLEGWAFTIMKNIFINDYLKVKRFRSLVDSTNNFISLNLLNSSESYNPDYTFTIKEINNVIASFPEEYRIPFEMFVAGYNYKDIANNLNIPLGTVKSRIFHMRQKLKIRFKDYL